jgi:hypothetical protein
MSCDGEDFRLQRWLVSFASGPRWYSVGEFVALDANEPIAMSKFLLVDGRK